MKQKFINSYVLVSALVAITTTVWEVQPARVFIDFLAPNPGDEYNLVFVLLMTFLVALIPLLIFLAVMRLFRSAQPETIQTGNTGLLVTRQKSLTSAMVGVPIYINDKKIGEVDNGKTMFFGVSAGTHTLQAGKGKQASEKIEVRILEQEQLKFDMHFNTGGLYPKIELNLIKS